MDDPDRLLADGLAAYAAGDFAAAQAAWQAAAAAGSQAAADHLQLLAEGDARKVLAIIGTNDPYTPPNDVIALRELGVNVVEYEGAEHAFAHDPSRPAHRKDDAADAFARSRAWLMGE